MNWKRLLGNIGGMLLAGFLAGQATNGVVTTDQGRGIEAGVLAAGGVVAGLFQKRPHKDDQ